MKSNIVYVSQPINMYSASATDSFIQISFLSEDKQIFPDIFSSVPDMAELVKSLWNLTAEVNHIVGRLDIPAGSSNCFIVVIWVRE